MKKIDWIIAGAIAAVAAVFYFFNLADYTFPGESAKLIVLWSGLDVSNTIPYPITAFFAKIVDPDTLSAICGIIATILAYALPVMFMKMRDQGAHTEAREEIAYRVFGGATAFTFAFTPAIIEASTHLSVQVFNTALALIILLLVLFYTNTTLRIASLIVCIIGIMTGLLLINGLETLPIALLIIALTVAAASRRGSNPGLVAFLSVFFILATYFIMISPLTGNMSDSLKQGAEALKLNATRSGSLATWTIAIAPAILAYFVAFSFKKKSTFSSWVFHIALTFVSILAIASPLSPSDTMSQAAYLPVMTSLFAAAVAGYTLAYWVKQFFSEDKTSKTISLITIPLLSLIIVISALINIFTFDGNKGSFADKMADKIIAKLENRQWFVTDGTLDNHLRLSAQRNNKKLNLICLQRDNDERYVEKLRKIVKEANVCGPKNEELLLSLSLGVLTFIQDWIAADPTIGQSVAIFGAPELWHSAHVKPIPELFFFGADEKRVPDWSEWAAIDKLLFAPKGWGSYKIHQNKNPVEFMRLSLRRHMGLMANNRGVYLQDNKQNDEAWKMYELVRNEIDKDNICALFNEFEMARAGYQAALKRKNDIEKSFKAITDEKDRRYILWQLANYYGYIRNPEIFVRLGCAWANSGRPGDALAHIRRAIDFVPTDKRASLLNMMAALYASSSDTVKSRDIYEEVLTKNAADHDALIGLMRVELLDGNSEKALQYLERAVKSGRGERANMEVALVHIIKNQYEDAKRILKNIVDANPKNIQAWSLLSSVMMQQADAAKDPKEKKRIEKEIENSIIPQMDKNADNQFNYHVQMTKSFLLLRRGENKRREARDAFAQAASAHPDVAAVQDIVLQLDISLNDTEDAEKHARRILKRNRKAPLANYVMGSLALQKGDYSSAEAFLRRSANATRPVPLAQNDLAEVLRRQRRFKEASQYAYAAVKSAPELYVTWETLASILLDSGHHDIDEIEKYARKALEVAKKNGVEKEDVRVLITLARVLIKKGDIIRAKATLGKVRARIDELSEFEKKEYEELRKHVR